MVEILNGLESQGVIRDARWPSGGLPQQTEPIKVSLDEFQKDKN